MGLIRSALHADFVGKGRTHRLSAALWPLMVAVFNSLRSPDEQRPSDARDRGPACDWG
jgi:hypothetical protein